MKVPCPPTIPGILLHALWLGMPILRHVQIYGLGEADAEVKPDDSLVTYADRKIERVMREYLAAFGEVYGEEYGRFGDGEGDYLFVVDPVDGTRTLANGDAGGSSIIVYAYDKRTKRIVASAIGRPGTGEVWIAYDGITAKHVFDGEQFTHVKDCKVRTFIPDANRPTVYTEYPSGTFARRGGVRMLTEAGQLSLTTEIRRAGFHHFVIGSNGTHHSLLAGGGEVAGTITTAIGGIQDLGGILIVEGAGGVARAFRMGDDRQLHDCHPHEDLLMPGGYDFLVMAINDDVAERLTGMLRRAAAFM